MSTVLHACTLVANFNQSPHVSQVRVFFKSQPFRCGNFFSIGFVRVDNQRCFFTWAMNISWWFTKGILLGKIDLDYNDCKTLSGWVGCLRNWLLCFWQVYHPHQSRSTCLPLNSIWMFTPQKTNMTQENPPFEDVFPIEIGNFLMSC